MNLGKNICECLNCGILSQKIAASSLFIGFSQIFLCTYSSPFCGHDGGHWGLPHRGICKLSREMSVWQVRASATAFGAAFLVTVSRFFTCCPCYRQVIPSGKLVCLFFGFTKATLKFGTTHLCCADGCCKSRLATFSFLRFHWLSFFGLCWTRMFTL